MAASFVLVHGGQQGAWAWELVVPHLRRAGHEVVAVDLPAGDLTAGATRYAQVIADAASPLGEDVILVGHSMGGLTIPLVPALRPVARLVFVCAAYPEPGRSHMQVKAEEPGEGVDRSAAAAWEQPGDAHVLPREIARRLFFGDCPRDLQEWALDRLRLQARKPLREVTPLVAWPTTPCTLVMTADDLCIPPEAARRTAQRLFGRDPIELPGGHCPSLSRPAALAELLLSTVD